MSGTSDRDGIGLVGATALLFVGLKLTHYIDWSWWWVLAPLWLGAALFVAIMMVVLVLSEVVKK